ncbi:MAG: hypothetical protein RJQ08_13615 [Salinisphaeraceae bacterium]
MNTKSERFEMRISSDLVAHIDAWRRIQDDIPSRSEAARRLIVIGLGKEGDSRSTRR